MSCQIKPGNKWVVIQIILLSYSNINSRRPASSPSVCFSVINSSSISSCTAAVLASALARALCNICLSSLGICFAELIKSVATPSAGVCWWCIAVAAADAAAAWWCFVTSTRTIRTQCAMRCVTTTEAVEEFWWWSCCWKAVNCWWRNVTG